MSLEHKYRFNYLNKNRKTDKDYSLLLRKQDELVEETEAITRVEAEEKKKKLEVQMIAIANERYRLETLNETQALDDENRAKKYDMLLASYKDLQKAHLKLLEQNKKLLTKHKTLLTKTKAK